MNPPFPILPLGIAHVGKGYEAPRLEPRHPVHLLAHSSPPAILAIPVRTQAIRPTVLEWVPNEQLHWKLTMLGGLVRTIRYLEIEAIAGAGCIISNGEIFGGFLGSRVAKRMGRNIQRAFLQNNEDLKARAEALWEARRS